MNEQVDGCFSTTDGNAVVTQEKRTSALEFLYEEEKQKRRSRKLLGFNGTLGTFHAPHHDHNGRWTFQHALKYSKDGWHKVLIRTQFSPNGGT
ncbi:hypothetical protein Q8A67_018132 [Cirrhinus molitorella]|uniref:Uncharacterized protein n=1 Tax=Cirrhinus molitorella TaxID=172907 RepID=A0AA88PFI4_9TELE|nr:hypothetical protein Q8A67_018132 [Cirrhinus molitorella]